MVQQPSAGCTGPHVRRGHRRVSLAPVCDAPLVLTFNNGAKDALQNSHPSVRRTTTESACDCTRRVLPFQTVGYGSFYAPPVPDIEHPVSSVGSAVGQHPQGLRATLQTQTAQAGADAGEGGTEIRWNRALRLANNWLLLLFFFFAPVQYEVLSKIDRISMHCTASMINCTHKPVQQSQNRPQTNDSGHTEPISFG